MELTWWELIIEAVKILALFGIAWIVFKGREDYEEKIGQYEGK